MPPDWHHRRSFFKSGMATVNMPGGEILAAGERGFINCAEWVGAGDDSIVGFDTIWKHFYPQSVHGKRPANPP